MADSDGVGARLKRAREARGLSQVVLASRAGVDQTTVSKTERGKLHPEEGTLGRLADALGVTVSWLSTGTGNGPAAPSEDSQTRRIAAPPALFEEALETAFDKARGHRLADVDALRKLFAGETTPGTATIETLGAAAGRMLDAAVELRREGDTITLAKLMLKVAS